MTNLQLLLSIGIPTVSVLLSIMLNNARFSNVESKLATIENDLRVFYRDMGRHDKAIEALGGRRG